MSETSARTAMEPQKAGSAGEGHRSQGGKEGEEEMTCLPSFPPPPPRLPVSNLKKQQRKVPSAGSPSPQRGRKGTDTGH